MNQGLIGKLLRGGLDKRGPSYSRCWLLSCVHLAENTHEEALMKITGYNT